MTFAPNQPVAFAVGVLVGLGSISFLTASTAIVQIRSDPTMRGRVLALQAMVFLGSTPIGGPIVGAISEHWGARYGVGVGAVAALGAGTWGLAVARRCARDRAALDAIEAEESVEDAIRLGSDATGPVPVVP
jgi:MFS family permease